MMVEEEEIPDNDTLEFIIEPAPIKVKHEALPLIIFCIDIR
jgi:hypothetical protein